MRVIGKRSLVVWLIGLLGCLFLPVCVECGYTGEGNQPLANLEFINVELRQVFHSLAAAGGFNVILDQTVKGTTSTIFKAGITGREAVAVIAGNYGYDYRWLPDSKTVFKTVPKAVFKEVFVGDIRHIKEDNSDRLPADIQLKFIDAAEAVGSLEVVIPKERIKPDSNGHKITVFGNSLEIENAKEIISGIDHEKSNINVEVKVVEVTDTFWKILGIDSTAVHSHMGIYPLATGQLPLLNDQLKVHFLSRQNITLFDNQVGKIFFGDKFGKNYDQTGIESASNEYVDIGTTMNITSWVGEGTKTTLQVKELTQCMSTQNASTQNAPTQNALEPKTVSSNPLPRFCSREVTSIISAEIGTPFILTGMLGRDEFNQMRKIPGKYPVLSELFTTENAFRASPKLNTQVIILITTFFGKNRSLATKQDVLSNNTTRVTSNLAGSYGKGLIVLMGYIIKSNDTITGISSKFRIDRQALVTANHWTHKKVTIKPNSRIWIPVPSERIYPMKPKETLWRIAKRYGITVDLLKDLNNIINIRKVKAGQKIVLPVSTGTIKHPQF